MPVTTQVRVRYAETDQMGIVYYANYFIWFELGRVELLRSLGLAYSRLEDRARMHSARGFGALPLSCTGALRR